MKRFFSWRLFTLFLVAVTSLFAIYTNNKQAFVPIPVPDNNWWMIAPAPDLSKFGLQPEPSDYQANQPNDHHIFQDDEGLWHLWASIRNTRIGEILAHWQADSLTQSPWTFTGDIIRADRSAGESLTPGSGQEFIQSPFIVKNKDLYYMFYGGYDSGLDADGHPTAETPDYNMAEKQICLMTSKDGRTWVRHKNETGYSRVFIGPGATRNPCVVKFGDMWYCYYAGHHNRDRTCGGIYVRTSKDLIHWSDWRIAQYDKSMEGSHWLPDSPAVIKQFDYYYLFRTNGAKAGTFVFYSTDPEDFGQGDVTANYLTHLDLIAPEIIIDENGDHYITKIFDPSVGFGIQMTRLGWALEPKRKD